MRVRMCSDPLIITVAIRRALAVKVIGESNPVLHSVTKICEYSFENVKYVSNAFDKVKP